jgi:hypothetical protein
MRRVRRLGSECLNEAEEALRRVKKNEDDATAVYHYTKAYKLLTAYYERNVLAATSALIYGFGGPESTKRDAEQFADEAVPRYQIAINFIEEAIDRHAGRIKGKWLDGKALSLPQLIEREKGEREDLPALFLWDRRSNPDSGQAPGKSAGPQNGTYEPSGRQ